MNVLVDSSVWIDYFNGSPTWQADLLDELLSSTPVSMGDLIYAEVLQGFGSERDYLETKELFDALPFHILGGREVALQGILMFRSLRSRGITVRKTVDIFIGSFCILNDFLLLHNDRDFLPLQEHCGLKAFERRQGA